MARYRHGMPVQQGIVLTQARVRVPSRFTLFLTHTFAGGIGAVAVAAVAEGLKKNTRLPPVTRAILTAATGVVGGSLVGRNSPRIGAGLALGGIAASVPALVEGYETMAAVREAAPAPAPAAPAPAPAAPAPAPAAPTTGTSPGAPVAGAQGGQQGAPATETPAGLPYGMQRPMAARSAPAATYIRSPFGR